MSFFSAYNGLVLLGATMPLEIVVIGLVLAAGADFNYFTWWGMLFMMITLIVAAAPLPQSIVDRIKLAFLCNSMLISLAMPVMSFIGCQTLVNNAVAIGPITYAAGNFLIHYWPSVRAVSMAPFRVDAALTLDGAALAVAFVLVFNPSDTYGCMPINRAEFMIGAGVGAAVIEGIARQILA